MALNLSEGRNDPDVKLERDDRDVNAGTGENVNDAGMELLVRIDERTLSMAKIQAEIQADVKGLSDRTTQLENDLSILRQAHNDRTASGDCSVSVAIEPKPKKRMSSTEIGILSVPPSAAAFAWAMVEIVKAFKS